MATTVPAVKEPAVPSALMVYLEEQSALLRSGAYWNCLVAARRIFALLLAEGRSPCVLRLRKTGIVGGLVYHAPLAPRSLGVAATWTTHYVTCCDGIAYDPVAGKLIPLETYSLEVFGEQIPAELFAAPGQLPG